ncbi:hypothetical protein J2X69_001288 [Algoriphagus sp. 4150]|uniref:DUF6850 family outer membrane beta-barrel protein n=1 Tax=Algoriphagus sp. 4150 TaxID=2817756 RepID=UPI0028569492|nr:DUF6850 family outer membrane beta-barrel protein [Algoriphagus sp. 4150]MDR7128953.1 hypothetical protein [Algoriphagus sp. 4150]
MIPKRVQWFLGFLFCPLVSGGQNFPIDRIFYQNLPFVAQLHEYSYLLQKGQPTFYEAGLGYTSRLGIREQPFDTHHLSQAYFQSASVMELGSWMMAGNFNYHKTLRSKRPYLLQTADWGVVPYRLMDKDIQPWSGDEVSFQVGFSSPEYGSEKRWQTVGNLAYEVGTHTRNAEPRPLARTNRYIIGLGQNFRTGAYTSVSAGIQLLSAKEENHIGSYAVQDAEIYQGRGWGTFMRNIYQSFQRTQSLQGTNVSFAMQYRKVAVHAFTEMKFKTKSYEARDGVAFPLNGGAARMKGLRWTGGLDFSLNGIGQIESLLSIDSERLSGNDPVFNAINVEGDFRKVSWVNIANLGAGKDWQAEFQLQYRTDNSEDLAAREQVSISVFSLKASVLKRFGLGKSLFYINPSVETWNAKSDLVYDSSKEISHLLLGPQQAFYSRSFLEPGLGAKWMVPLSDENKLLVGSRYSHRLSRSYPLHEFSFFTQLLF